MYIFFNYYDTSEYNIVVYIDTIIDYTFRTYLLNIYDPFEIDHDIVISHRFGGNVLL